MRIAVNARLLIPDKLEGIGWYSVEVLRRLVRDHPDDEFIFFLDRAHDGADAFGPNVTTVVLPPQARHPILWHIWFQWSVRAALSRYRPDVFYSPDGFLCLGSDVPSVGVIHDLNFERDEWHLPWTSRTYYRRFFPRFAAHATRLITISDFCLNDIRTRYGVAAHRIRRVYNGVHESYVPVSADRRADVRQRLTSGEPYFLFVGAQHPRKNLARLLMAFDLYCERYGTTHRLVLAGKRMFRDTETDQAFAAMKHSSRVVFTGRLEQEELAVVTGSADALVFVSLFEGFGVPIVEAMRCGVPVITSTTSCMPEIADGAALLCEPTDVDAITEAMHSIVIDAPLRAQLVERGFHRARAFSFDTTAAETWQVILDAVHAP
jgi:glycosyltransferase involved in cell wall biosynthesis